jgi:hypothetical protein
VYGLLNGSVWHSGWAVANVVVTLPGAPERRKIRQQSCMWHSPKNLRCKPEQAETISSRQSIRGFVGSSSSIAFACHDLHQSCCGGCHMQNHCTELFGFPGPDKVPQRSLNSHRDLLGSSSLPGGSEPCLFASQASRGSTYMYAAGLAPWVYVPPAVRQHTCTMPQTWTGGTAHSPGATALGGNLCGEMVISSSEK